MTLVAGSMWQLQRNRAAACRRVPQLTGLALQSLCQLHAAHTRFPTRRRTHLG